MGNWASRGTEGVVIEPTRSLEPALRKPPVTQIDSWIEVGELLSTPFLTVALPLKGLLPNPIR